jgi:hypothetical protein
MCARSRASQDRYKSIPLRLLRPWLDRYGLNFVVLQKDVPRDDVAVIRTGPVAHRSASPMAR